MIEHEKINKYQCKECNKSFLRNTHLLRHLLSHDKNNLTKICHLCCKTFNRIDNLKRHLKTHKIVIFNLKNHVNNRKNLQQSFKTLQKL